MTSAAAAAAAAVLYEYPWVLVITLEAYDMWCGVESTQQMYLL